MSRVRLHREEWTVNKQFRNRRNMHLCKICGWLYKMLFRIFRIIAQRVRTILKQMLMSLLLLQVKLRLTIIRMLVFRLSQTMSKYNVLKLRLINKSPWCTYVICFLIGWGGTLVNLTSSLQSSATTTQLSCTGPWTTWRTKKRTTSTGSASSPQMNLWTSKSRNRPELSWWKRSAFLSSLVKRRYFPFCSITNPKSGPRCTISLNLKSLAASTTNGKCTRM